MRNVDLPPAISMGIYNNGNNMLLLAEGSNRETNLADLWAFLYLQSLTNANINTLLFRQQKEEIQIGQTCSSETLVVSDSQISLMGAASSLVIQKKLENGLQDNGEIFLWRSNEYSSLVCEFFNVPKCIQVPAGQEKIWNVRLSESVENEMRNQANAKRPNETGGVLIGSVFLNSKTIVISRILPPPPDSIESSGLFVLGIEGLEKKIKGIEQKTNGKLTYLGTWHSHPSGGGASDKDDRTFQKLLFVRDYEPTICLIWSASGVLQI